MLAGGSPVESFTAMFSPVRPSPSASYMATIASGLISEVKYTTESELGSSCSREERAISSPPLVTITSPLSSPASWSPSVSPDPVSAESSLAVSVSSGAASSSVSPLSAKESSESASACASAVCPAVSDAPLPHPLTAAESSAIPSNVETIFLFIM